MLTFLVNQTYNEAFWGVYFVRIPPKNLHSNLVLVVILVLESKRKVSIVKWQCVSSDMTYKEISEKN